jgi:hypothetical protein
VDPRSRASKPFEIREFTRLIDKPGDKIVPAHSCFDQISLKGLSSLASDSLILEGCTYRDDRANLHRFVWHDPVRSVRSLRESYCPQVGKEDNRSDGTCETPAYAGADHQEAA